MDDIIIRVLNGRAEPIEERRLANWRAESSQNEQHFTEVSAIWDWSGSDALAIDSESLAAAPTLETIVRQGEALNRRDVRRRFARGLGRKEIRPWAAAAVIAAVSLGVWIGRVGPGPEGVMGTEYVAASTEAATVALADGSFVRLAPGSRVRFAEGGELREAWLSGRAAEVSRGQVARLGTNGDFSVETVENVYDLLDWPGGILLFQGTPLPQVVQEVSAHFGVAMVLDDPALTVRTLTAWFVD